MGAKLGLTSVHRRHVQPRPALGSVALSRLRFCGCRPDAVAITDSPRGCPCMWHEPLGLDGAAELASWWSAPAPAIELCTAWANGRYRVPHAAHSTKPAARSPGTPFNSVHIGQAASCVDTPAPPGAVVRSPLPTLARCPLSACRHSAPPQAAADARRRSAALRAISRGDSPVTVAPPSRRPPPVASPRCRRNAASNATERR